MFSVICRIREMNRVSAIVLHLVEPLLDRGHPVWLDNFYNSPSLAMLPKHKGTHCAGTLNK
jgi:hypothetical protein